MKRLTAAAGSALFLVVAPGTIAGYGPWAISRWRLDPEFFPLARALGVLFVVAGLPALLDSFGRFAVQGFGTPAPVAPPARLVVTGLYRHVRNPMYVSVASLVFGQALLFGSVPVFAYGAVVALGFHLFVLLYEEPALRAKFGSDYETYCENVRRWLPRLSPYRQRVL